jgi:hypothetical protein
MLNVVFVAPFLMETTLRFVDATAALPGVRLGLVTQDPVERLSRQLRGALAAHERTSDALDPERIAVAVRAIGDRIGPVKRLLGALEELQVPLGEVRSMLKIPGMDAVTARNFRDKARMKEIFEEAGVPCARHRRVTSEAQAWTFAEQIGYPMIVKPTAGSGSRNTFRVDNAEMLRESLAWGSPTADHATMTEEFITGKEYSFDSVFLGGRVAWYSINHYFPGPLEVLENPWIQWCVILPREVDRPEYARIRAVAPQALRSLGMVSGLSHMEWFQRDDGSVAISEVGARPPGAQFTTLISYAHDTDFYRAWAELMAFERFDPPGRPFAAGAAFLRGQGSGRIKAIHGLDEAQTDLGSVAVEAKLPRPGQPTSGTYDGDGYVIVRHPETAVVEKALARIVRTIQVETE